MYCQARVQSPHRKPTKSLKEEKKKGFGLRDDTDVTLIHHVCQPVCLINNELKHFNETFHHSFTSIIAKRLLNIAFQYCHLKD